MPTKSTAAVTAPSPKVVVAREIGRLAYVPERMTAEAAHDSAIVTRRKIEGIWLYAATEEDIDRATTEVLAAASELCQKWLLAAMRILAGKVAKDSGLVTMEVVRPLLRSYVRSGALLALPALTSDYEPHLSLFSPEDEDEIDHLVAEASALVSRVGYLAVGDLALPHHSRDSLAWRYTVLAHLEWLGLGSYAEARLQAWGDL